MRRVTAIVVMVALAVGTGIGASGSEAAQGGVGGFEPVGEMRLGHRAGQAVVPLPDGRVLVVGGTSGDDFTKDVQVWDPATGQLTRAGSLLGGRSYPSTAVLPDGRVLVVGGKNRRGVLRSAELWDPATERLTPAGELDEPRFRSEAVVLSDGRVVVAGGSGERYLDTVEVWDPQTNDFTTSGLLPRPMAVDSAVALPDDRVLLVGGYTARYGNRGRERDWRAVRQALIWDPATSTAMEAGDMTAVRTRHTATLLSDGRVLVVGGESDDNAVATAEVWDPSTSTFTSTGSMAEPRLFHTATALPDGRVLVTGGGGAHGNLGTTELWDPATDSFTPSGPLGVARAQHGAGLLDDGRVLVFGGFDEGPVPALIEAWDPTVVVESPVPGASLALTACAPVDASADAGLSSLVDRFPQAIGKQEVRVTACQGAEWLALHDPADPATATILDRAESFVKALGRSIDDVMVATTASESGPDRAWEITALSVAGARATEIAEPAIPLVLGIERPAIQSVIIDEEGNRGLQVRDESVSGSKVTTIYAPLGDTIWLISVDRPRRLERIVKALPGPGGRFVAPDIGVAVTFPEDWRVEVMEQRLEDVEEWFGPDTVAWDVVAGRAPDTKRRGGGCSLRLYRPTELTAMKAFRRFFTTEDEPSPKPEVLTDGMLRFGGPGSFFGGETEMAFYFIQSDDAVVRLWCLADKAPRNQWLPLARSVEIVPIEQGDEP